mmetsp:Transcript_23394/g.57351  ORF Transcript_23394/g.57351 Transcript_23394/m.57351 type:complete len:86 (-) Transcript_23394:2516-2773(-)
MDASVGYQGDFQTLRANPIYFSSVDKGAILVHINIELLVFKLFKLLIFPPMLFIMKLHSSCVRCCFSLMLIQPNDKSSSFRVMRN